jgi:hypothetical protein
MKKKQFVKFDNKVLYYDTVNQQLSLDGSGDFDFEFNIKHHPEYRDIATKIFDSHQKFSIILPRCRADGSFIKMMNYDDEKMILYITCGRIIHINAKDYRNKVIGKILETGNNSNNTEYKSN